MICFAIQDSQTPTHYIRVIPQGQELLRLFSMEYVQKFPGMKKVKIHIFQYKVTGNFSSNQVCHFYPLRGFIHVLDSLNYLNVVPFLQG